MAIEEASNMTRHFCNLLKKMGYRPLSPSEVLLAQGGVKDVPLLEDILEQQLIQLNKPLYQDNRYKFSVHSIEEAFLSLKYAHPSQYNKMYNLLLHGKPHLETVQSGGKRINIQYIDWDNAGNNKFHYVREFEATFGNEKVKIDLILFVNGIPIVLVDFNSSGANHMVFDKWEALNSKQHKNTPVSFSQLFLSISPYQVKYNTTSGGSNVWPIWRTSENDVTIVEDVVYNLCEPTNLLHYIKHFILNGDETREAARRHQVNAVQQALKRINSHKRGDLERGGVIAHPAGSGIVTTIMFLAQNLLMAKQIAHSKILIVTDRQEIDEQIENTFSQYGLPIAQASSGRHLLELLGDGPTIITTTLKKLYHFLPAPFYDRDQELFILVEEIQRGNSGALHQKLREIFPSACYIGFTKMPVLKKEYVQYSPSGLIHSFTLTEAMENNISLPILFESRYNKAEVHPENVQKVKKTWKKLDQSITMVSNDETINRIADDITSHFYAYNKGTSYKAILATPSRLSAIKYKQYFDSKKGSNREINTAIFISNMSDMPSPFFSDYEDQQDYEQNILQEIKSSPSEVELIIVCDRLLTGFDAPLINTIYLTKYLRSHSLLQAIATVNRPYPGKTYGLVVDYVGVIDQMKTDLSPFNEQNETGKKMIIPVREEVQQLKYYIAALDDLKNALLKTKGKKSKTPIYYRLSEAELKALYLRKLEQCEVLLKLSDCNTSMYSLNEMKSYEEQILSHRELLKSIQSPIGELSFLPMQTVNILLPGKEAVPHFLAEDQLAITFFMLLKGILGNKGLLVKDEQIAECALQAATNFKTLSIRDWQISTKVRREMNNSLEDLLVAFNRQYDSVLSFSEIDDLLDSFLKAADSSTINNNKE
ncbi:HsdR family type I site-specific deoxyribonuclease [Chitinophaga sp. RCC_12]|uniref:HsdR family type I site-specific deoxyribonuclease n=1 Tax=Chitinophaga sp. RCC_12 TaxID=3239226 RepID=UPI0035241DB5